MTRERGLHPTRSVTSFPREVTETALAHVIGDKAEQAYPSVFTAWLAIRSRGSVRDRWRSFVNFYLDVGPRPSWRHLLIRDDTTGDFEAGQRPMADCGEVSMRAITMT